MADPLARLRRAWRGHPRLFGSLVVFAAVAATLAAAVSMLTSLETYGDSRVVSDVPRPAWSAPCFQHEPRGDRRLLARCARATGIVAHVRTNGSAASAETHFALIGRFGLLIVKLGDPRLLKTPSVGSRITAVGPLVRAANYNLREIEAWSVR
jgi:hypothetical protein